VIAAMQQWRCALCGQILPARYTLPFLFCLWALISLNGSVNIWWIKLSID
jgi:hypothetical protein